MKNVTIPPFEKRWNIPIDIDAIRGKFINRIWNGLNEEFKYLVMDDPSYQIRPTLRHVADGLGKQYYEHWGFPRYIDKNNFNELLHALELLYEELAVYSPVTLEYLILRAISLSEIDLGIRWQDGAFWPSGAKLLDEELVNEPMQWLSDPKYKNVLDPFQKGLKHYMEATKDASKLSDTITDMYEAVEKLARIVNGNNNTLGANAKEFISKLCLNDHYAEMLSKYCQYAHDYRHAVKQDQDRRPPTSQETEAFIYMTGLFIRLAVKQLDSK